MADKEIFEKNLGRLIHLAGPELQLPNEKKSQILEKLTAAGAAPEAVQKPEPIWRIIMKTKTRKLTSVVAAVLIIAFGIFILDKLTTPVWAIDQTIKALDKVSTIIVSGTTAYDDGTISLPFKTWIKLNDKNGNLFLRFECEREFAIVRGDTAYFRDPETNEVGIMEGATVHNLQFWYKVMEFSPWFTGKMLKTLKSIASDWQETYGKHEKTGRDCVFVECGYKKLQASFWFVFDVESKLIVEGKHWMNTNLQGPPNFYATSFVYNEEIPDEMFEFEIPEDAEVYYMEPLNAEALNAEILNRKKAGKSLKEAQNDYSDALEISWQAFDLLKEQKYTESIELFEQVYEKYSYLDIGADALMWMGVCYSEMGQHGKAIELLEKTIKEYPAFKNRLVDIYDHLGGIYLKTGQKDKALEAFKNCLRAGKDFRYPQESQCLKEAQRFIEKIEAEKK